MSIALNGGGAVTAAVDRSLVLTCGGRVRYVVHAFNQGNLRSKRPTSHCCGRGITKQECGIRDVSCVTSHFLVLLYGFWCGRVDIDVNGGVNRSMGLRLDIENWVSGV